MNAFTALFLTALAISTGVRLWLARRHVQHILAHRAAVPSAFATSISLEAHQKPFRLMGSLLKEQPRDIVYNLCQAPTGRRAFGLRLFEYF